jgi:Tfp pilus assembly protein PilN
MKSHVNLLPGHVRRRLTARIRIAQWSFVWLTCVAILGGIMGFKFREMAFANSRLAELEASSVPIRQAEEENQRMRASLTALADKASILASLGVPLDALQAIGLVSRGADQCEGKLWVDSLSLTAAPATAAGGNAAPHGLVLRGTAENDLAVTGFIVSLRETKAFLSVELKSSVEVESPEGSARNYLIECTF